MSSERLERLRALVRDVPDFPRPGINFKDLTPLLADRHALTICIDLFAERWVGEHLDAVVGIESRGFIFAAPLAVRLGAAFVPVRKPGKLPRATDRVTYALEYGTDALEMHLDALRPGMRVLVADDVLATGGTAAAACELARRQQALVVGAAFVVALRALRGVERLAGIPVQVLLEL
ncbi:MAG: adenine phosphoribosyltransferase [Myxococcota bacterium]|nr:adenine phosphoribosyltransferase [Myxococcota bacterium]